VAASNRDMQLEADLQASRQREARKALILAGVVGLIGAVSIVSNVPDALSGSVSAGGRVAVGVLGLAAAVLMRLRPSNGWLLAMAWAVVQIPFFAWSPDGGATAQALQLPLTITSSSSVNGQLTAYSSVGVNLAGVAFVMWLRLWQGKFDR
jgi:hypothetical protein